MQSRTRKSELFFFTNGRNVLLLWQSWHKLPQCHFKDKHKAEWDINKSQLSHAQAGKTETNISKSTPASNNKQPTQMHSKG
jgi:hypothetical protein